MGTTYFTSDTHFFHKNIIRPNYCDRPFKLADGQPDIAAMHRTIVERWNAIVKPDDLVWHLGDVSFGSIPRTREILNLLNGHKVLIKGNHDPSTKKCYDMGFEHVAYRDSISVDGHKIFIVHKPDYAFKAHEPYNFNPSQPDYYDEFDYLLCGHVHERWTRRGDVINVGVDKWDFTPRTIAELIAAPQEPESNKLTELDYI